MSEVAVPPEWNLTSIGLQLNDPDLPYTRFTDLCFTLGRLHEAVRFAIGDAILLGEELYGEKAYQAIEEMNLTEDQRQEYVRVAKRVPRSVRREGVTWSNHRAVAALPLPEQKAWLKRCAEEDLSAAQLRDELRNGAEPIQQTACRCCGRPL